MDEQAIEDFKELCVGASNEELIGLCEYEIRNAKKSVLDEDKEMHMILADVAFTEMEARNIV